MKPLIIVSMLSVLLVLVLVGHSGNIGDCVLAIGFYLALVVPIMTRAIARRPVQEVPKKE